jgi:hypothetical protein
MHGVPQQNNIGLELGIQHYYARTSCTNPVLKKSMCSSIKMLGDKRPHYDISDEQDDEASAEARLSLENENPPHPTGATTPQDSGGGDAWGGAAGGSPSGVVNGWGGAAGASPQKCSRLQETVSTVYSAVGGFVTNRRDWVAAEYQGFKTFCDDSARLAAIQATYTGLHERMDDSLADFQSWSAGVGDATSVLASSLDALSPVRTTGLAVVRHCPTCVVIPPVILHEANGCTHDKQGRPSCYSCQTCSRKWNVCKKCDQLKRFSIACPTCPK